MDRIQKSLALVDNLFIGLLLHLIENRKAKHKALKVDTGYWQDVSRAENDSSPKIEVRIM